MRHSSEIHGKNSKKAQEYLEGWKRARAELINFRQRSSRDQQAFQGTAKRILVEPLLSVLDNLQASARHVSPELKDHTWVVGVLHTTRQFEQCMTQLGITPIPALHQPFDPRLHEAVEQVTAAGDSANYPSGTIVAVVQEGYQLDGQVIRPARVKVIQ
jgi:molecular chaperone GrpE